MEENKNEVTYVDNGNEQGFLPMTEEDHELACNESDDSINPVVVGGAVAIIAGAGFGLYKLGKWAAGKIGDKMEKGRISKLEKRGYIVIPQRDTVEEEISEAPEEAFEEEPQQEEKNPSRSNKKETK